MPTAYGPLRKTAQRATSTIAGREHGDQTRGVKSFERFAVNYFPPSANLCRNLALLTAQPSAFHDFSTTDDWCAIDLSIFTYLLCELGVGREEAQFLKEFRGLCPTGCLLAICARCLQNRKFISFILVCSQPTALCILDACIPGLMAAVILVGSKRRLVVRFLRYF